MPRGHRCRGLSARPAPPGGAPWRLTWGGGEGRGRPGPPCHSLVGPDPLAVGSLASGVCRRVGPGALRSSSVVMPPPHQAGHRPPGGPPAKGAAWPMRSCVHKLGGRPSGPRPLRQQRTPPGGALRGSGWHLLAAGPLRHQCPMALVMKGTNTSGTGHQKHQSRRLWLLPGHLRAARCLRRSAATAAR